MAEMENRPECFEPEKNNPFHYVSVLAGKNANIAVYMLISRNHHLMSR